VIASADVAHRGKAGGKRPPRVLGHAQDAETSWIAVLCGRIGKSRVGEVDVAVDESRGDGPVGDIEARGIGRGIDVPADRTDAVAFDEHSAGTHRCRTRAVDEHASHDEDGARVQAREV
jgi:hypothetical protein